MRKILRLYNNVETGSQLDHKLYLRWNYEARRMAILSVFKTPNNDNDNKTNIKEADATFLSSVVAKSKPNILQRIYDIEVALFREILCYM